MKKRWMIIGAFLVAGILISLVTKKYWQYIPSSLGLLLELLLEKINERFCHWHFWD